MSEREGEKSVAISSSKVMQVDYIFGSRRKKGELKPHSNAMMKK
jgi:hypothetical protein